MSPYSIITLSSAPRCHCNEEKGSRVRFLIVLKSLLVLHSLSISPHSQFAQYLLTHSCLSHLTHWCIWHTTGPASLRRNENLNIWCLFWTWYRIITRLLTVTFCVVPYLCLRDHSDMTVGIGWTSFCNICKGGMLGMDFLLGSWAQFCGVFVCVWFLMNSIYVILSLNKRSGNRIDWTDE